MVSYGEDNVMSSKIENIPLPVSTNVIKIVPACRCNIKCILSFLEPEELAVWKTLQIKKTYQKNEIIFREGEQTTGLYLVCKGLAKLSKSHSDGHQLIVRIVSPGNFFGLPPLICNRNHFTTAQTVDKVQLEYIPRGKFLDFLQAHPKFTMQLIDHVAKELCLARTRLRDFGCKNGRKRLADLLLWLGEEHGHPYPGGVELDIELSRMDIAGMAGLTSETTIRLISSFRSEGLITANRKKIIILDHERLRREVGDDLLIDHVNIFEE